MTAPDMTILVAPLVWDHDGRLLRLDDTMNMSKAYDWDGYECLRQEGYGLGCGYIIWPDSICSRWWNVYGTFDGLYIQNLDGEEAAKKRAQANYAARASSIFNPAGLSAMLAEAEQRGAARVAELEAERDRAICRANDQEDRADRYRYVLHGVKAAIDTGRNEPLMVWREQIVIALDDAAAIRARDNGEGGE
jgi:hypothetical protein